MMLRSVVESSGAEKSIGLPLRFMKTQYRIGKEGSEFEAGVSGSEAADHDNRTAPPVRASVAVRRPPKSGGTESRGVVGITVRSTVFVSSFPQMSSARTTNRYASPSVRPVTSSV